MLHNDNYLRKPLSIYKKDYPFVKNAQKISNAFYCVKSTCFRLILWIMWITSCISP